MDTFFFSDPHFGHANVLVYCSRPFHNTGEMKRVIIANFNAIVGPRDKVYFLGDIFFCGTIEATSILGQLNGYKILIRGNHDKGEDKMRQIGFDEVHEKLEIDIDGTKVKLCHFPYRPYTADINPKILARIAQIKGEQRSRVKVTDPQPMNKVSGLNGRLKGSLDEYPYCNMITADQKERLLSYDMRFWSRRYEDDGGWLLCGHVHEKWKLKGKMINVGVDVWDFKPVPISVIKSIIKGE